MDRDFVAGMLVKRKVKVMLQVRAARGICPKRFYANAKSHFNANASKWPKLELHNAQVLSLSPP